MSHDDRAPRRDTLLMVAVIFLVAALAALAMWWLPDRPWRLWRRLLVTGRPRVIGCVSSLSKINDAKIQWALEHRKTNGVPVPAQELVLYFRDKVLPTCPEGGLITPGKSGSPPTCSVGGSGHTL